MKINKKDLKIISYNFRCMASRMINCNFQESNSILKMFIKHIESDELIFGFVQSKVKFNYDIKKDIEENNENRQQFNTGETEDKEISYTYQLLKYMVENKVDFIGIAMLYSFSHHYQDMVKDFNNRVILSLINYIEAYLTRIGIEMGYDEEVKYMININNQSGQVIVSHDNSPINAEQNQSTDVDLKVLNDLIFSIEKLVKCSNVKPDIRETISDNISCVKEELQKQNPRHGLLKTCLSGLKNVLPDIKNIAELSTAVLGVIQIVSTVIH
jgi:hypothetical protein